MILVAGLIQNFQSKTIPTSIMAICLAYYPILFSSEWIGTKNVFSETECPNIGSGSTSSVEACQVFYLIGDFFFLHIFQDSCAKRSGCAAVNWKYEGNHLCILRACSLPVVPPKNSLHKWNGYYITTPTTTTTTSSSTTTTITTASLIGGSCFFYINKPCIGCL